MNSWWDLGEWHGYNGEKLALYNITCPFCMESGNFSTAFHAEKKQPNGSKVLNFNTLKCGNCASYVQVFWSSSGRLYDYRVLPWPLRIEKYPDYWPEAVGRYWLQSRRSLADNNWDAADEKACLYDLHEAIQDAVEFGRDHPFEFFLANSPSRGANRQWLTEKDEWEDKEDDFFRIKLIDIWPTGRKKLYYLFDFGDNRTFEIRKERGTKKPERGVEYPRLIKAIGSNPEQYPGFEE